MFMMRFVFSAVGYFNLILFCYIFWNNAPQRLYGEPLAGTVVDATTGKPIPGAYVSYLWQGATDPKGLFSGSGRDICYHAAGTVTDSDGRFHVKPWSEWRTWSVANQDPQALVYAPGYEPTTILLNTGRTVPPIRRLGERYSLNQDTEDLDKRFAALFFGFANRGCDYGGESQKSLYPMMKAIYAEAHGSAQTLEQIRTANSIGRFAARAALAIDPEG